MLRIGVTGGIGSGKSIVCRVVSSLGIPVFDAGSAARYLMEHDERLVAEISELFGAGIYAGGKLDRVAVTGTVFERPELLKRLNGIVHPATVEYARQWIGRQHAPYIIKEAAIFFESGTNREMDCMIGVWAPRELRIERAMKRNSKSRQDIIRVMEQQMDDEEKMRLCDFVIVNDDETAVLPQVLALHQHFMSLPPADPKRSPQL